MSKENLKIWDLFSKTDPNFTRRVKYGAREFTDINATYRTRRITEAFGPVGKRWSYDAVHSIESLPNGIVLAVCDVLFWWRESDDSEKHTFGPIRGINVLLNAKGHIDEDAPKKALTDAKTKAFAELGESADVYMGSFDDSRYVAERQADEQRKKTAESKEIFRDLMERMDKIDNYPHLKNWGAKHAAEVKLMLPDDQNTFRQEYAKKGSALMEGWQASMQMQAPEEGLQPIGQTFDEQGH